jgi:cyanate lyase
MPARDATGAASDDGDVEVVVSHVNKLANLFTNGVISTKHRPGMLGRMRREVLTEQIVTARLAKGLTWQQLADAIERPVVWTTAALLGQHPIPPEQAEVLAGLLGLDDDAVPVLASVPMRGGLPSAVPTDPTIYRFYEVLQVYGGAIKELIHEEFGDGIMSAINFSIDIARKPHPGGDRVVVTLDGKFLAYDWAAATH